MPRDGAQSGVDTISLATIPGQRATGTNFSRITNGIIEVERNTVDRSYRAYVRKRPGLANSTQPPGGAATGRGLYAWKATGKIYSIFDNAIYAATSDLGVTMAASSGKVWQCELPSTAAARLLIFSDGTDNYNITTADAITQIDEGDDAQYPTPNLGPVWYYYQHLIQGTTAYLVNTEIASVTSWLSADIKPIDFHGDDQEMFWPQKDRMLSLGRNSFEMFYYRGTPIASPLQRVQQNLLKMGIASRNTFAWSGDQAYYVAEGSGEGEGGRTILTIGADSGEQIGIPAINRVLAAEGSTISSSSAWCERLAGHSLYCLNLATQDKSFVYNAENKTWTEWRSASDGAFNVMAVTSLNGAIYGQDESNGRIYTFSDSTYQDGGTTFDVVIVTDNRGKSTQRRKFVQWVDLIADTESSGSATLESSDDYGTTWVTRGTFDMTSPRKRIGPCGSYRGERQYRLTHSANAFFRGQALQEIYALGDR